MTQVFIPVKDATCKLVQAKVKGTGPSNSHRRWVETKTGFGSLGRFCVHGKNELGTKKHEDKLVNLKIQKLASQPVIFKSNQTEELFQVTFHIAQISYLLVLAKYHHYKGFTNKIIVDYDYQFDGIQEGVVLVSVGDILKHHYYQNKADKQMGFNGLNSKTINDFKTIIKSSLTTIVL